MNKDMERQVRDSEVRPIYFLSYTTLEQAVYASKYIIKGIPTRIVYLDFKNKTYDESPCIKDCRDTLDSRGNTLGIEVNFQELIYEDKNPIYDWEGKSIDIQPINRETKTFLYAIWQDFTQDWPGIDTDIEIARRFLNEPHYFFCAKIMRFNNSKTSSVYCHFYSQPPIRPLPEDDWPKLQVAIKLKQRGIKPNPEYCHYRYKPPIDRKNLPINCP